MLSFSCSGGGPSCVRRSRSRSPGYHDSPRGRSRSRSRSYSAAQHYSRYDLLPSSCMLMETPCACNECANSIDWLTYHLDRSPSPRPRERSSPANSGSKSASPGASRSPPRQRSPSGGEWGTLELLLSAASTLVHYRISEQASRMYWVFRNLWWAKTYLWLLYTGKYWLYSLFMGYSLIASIRRHLFL